MEIYLWCMTGGVSHLINERWTLLQGVGYLGPRKVISEGPLLHPLNIGRLDCSRLIWKATRRRHCIVPDPVVDYPLKDTENEFFAWGSHPLLNFHDCHWRGFCMRESPASLLSWLTLKKIGILEKNGADISSSNLQSPILLQPTLYWITDYIHPWLHLRYKASRLPNDTCYVSLSSMLFQLKGNCWTSNIGKWQAQNACRIKVFFNGAPPLCLLEAEEG